MQIKIHVGSKTLYLCDTLSSSLTDLLHHPETVFIDELNNPSINSMFKELELPDIQTGIFLHPDFAALQKAVFKKMERLQAGGGLIVNQQNHVLMIFRRGFWDLPKGKLDPGETMEACAIREVREETGLSQVKIQAPLTITYHTYQQGTHKFLKESHWYLMQALGKETLVPQTEEDIELIKWVAQEELPEYLSKAFPSIVDVVSLWLHEST